MKQWSRLLLRLSRRAGVQTKTEKNVLRGVYELKSSSNIYSFEEEHVREAGLISISGCLTNYFPGLFFSFLLYVEELEVNLIILKTA